jgi:predicted acetyltransferase
VPAPLRFESPRRELRGSYCGLVDEVLALGEELIPFPLRFPHDDFEALLARLQDCAQGIGIADGFVPHTTWWLVRGASDVVGVVNLRHRLTPALENDGGHIGYGIRPSARRQGLGREILAQALVKARERGLARVRLTCARKNTASAKIIVDNGGVLDSEGFVFERGEFVRRYWIELRS